MSMLKCEILSKTLVFKVLKIDTREISKCRTFLLLAFGGTDTNKVIIKKLAQSTV